MTYSGREAKLQDLMRKAGLKWVTVLTNLKWAMPLAAV